MFDFLTKRFSSAFTHITGKNKLSEKNIQEALEKIKDSLLEADIAYEVVEKFISEVKSEVVGQKVVASVSPAEMLMKIVYEKLVSFLGGKDVAEYIKPASSSIVMVMGLQGSGKTTTIGKLAYRFLKESKKEHKKLSILAGSVDFYRPAAIEQLEIVAKQAGATFYKSSSTTPLEAARDIVAEYRQGGYDVLLLDTAGRMHVDDAMLKELEDIQKLVQPNYKLLVLDSMTGQDSLKVAKTFNERIGFGAAVLAKIDSDARGGAAFAFSYVLSRPVAYIGTGEKLEDLDVFRPDRMASRILGMGDVKTLSERIDEKIKASEQERMQKNFLEGNFTLEDFAQQLGMVGRLGSLSSLMKYMPGMGSLNINQGMIDQGEREMKKFKAIMSSMTSKERLQPAILNKSRKARIARGAGLRVSDVDGMLARFEQTRQFAKLFKKGGHLNNFFK